MSVISFGTPIIRKEIVSAAESAFTAEAGNVARKLNKIAINETKGDRVHYSFSKATPADLKRLTSKSMKDSYKRVTWVNPNDNTVYHILEEGRKGDKVQVRILDKDGRFVKNAELDSPTIVIFDNFFSPRGVTHGEMMETFIKRFNPFAKVERLEHKKGLYEFLKYFRQLPMGLETKRFSELEKQMSQGKKVDYISVSEVNLVDAEDVIGKTGREQRDYVAQSSGLTEIEPIFKRILSRGTRIFEAAGNDMNFAKEVVSDRLAIEGVEGVGSLRNGKIANDSCSRNSVFTQHYECRDYTARLVKDENQNPIGVNVTGMSGVDMPLNWKTRKLIGRNFGGTSYATPVRVAKISLNEMMSKII